MFRVMFHPKPLAINKCFTVSGKTQKPPPNPVIASRSIRSKMS